MLDKGSWTFVVIQNLGHLQLVTPQLKDLPDPLCDLAPWEDLCVKHKTTWKTIVSKAAAPITILFGCRKEETIPPPELEHRCPECSKQFASRTALAVHRRQTHDHLLLARFYADGSVCRGCQKQYHNRGRLLNHLTATPRCLGAAQMAREPLTREEVHALDACDREVRRDNRKRGLPVFFAEVPPVALEPSDGGD